MAAGDAGETASRAAAVTRAGFVALVDSCVRELAASLAGALPHPQAGAALALDRGRAQLWRWLHGGGAFLDDGTPIDFALFDAAVLCVGERLPRRGLPGQEKLLQAACLLAELTHARTPVESALALLPRRS